MIVNLAAHTAFDVDSTVSGTVALTRAQLQGLVDGDYITDVVTLSGSDILVLDVDYGNRIATEDLRYYFDSATASGTVASGIQWYYKNYDSNPWYPLTTTFGGGYYTTTAVSGTFYPQFVRMVHTISGTGIVGTAREYEVNSDDTIVDFGSDGSLETKHLTETPIGESDAFSVPIYNDGTTSATAYVYIGNTDTDADDMLKISDVENGTYVTLDDGKLIGGDGYQWWVGEHDDTTTDNDKLVLNSFGGSLSFTKLEDLPITIDTLERGVVRWHATNPNKSEVYYAQDSAFRMYSLEDDTDISRAVMPFTMNPRDRFIYDPEGDKIYAFEFNNTATQFWSYDPTTDTWSALLGSFSNSPVYDSPVGSLAFIPSNVLNDGARSIIAMCGTGRTNIDPTTPIRIRLTDHNVNTSWGNLTGFQEDWDGTNRTSEYMPIMNLTFQGSNLDAFPAGCQGVLWATHSNYIEVEWLNYFVIYEGDSNHRWYYLDLSNLPRNPTTYNRQDYWYLYNNDTWVYDEANNRVWYVEDPGWQDACLQLHYFDCDGTWNRGYKTMYSPYTVLDPDGWFWYDGSSASRLRNYMDGKVYGDSIYFVCMSGHDKNLIYLFTPGLGSGGYYEEGTYTTPIFKNTDPTYWRVKSEIPTGTDITASEDAVSPTIEIRSSDTAPTAEDSHYYVTFVRVGDYYYPTAYDYNGNMLWQDDHWGATHTYYYNPYWFGGEIATNKLYPNTGTSNSIFNVVIWCTNRDSNYYRYIFAIYDRAGNRVYERVLTYNSGGSPVGDTYWPTCAVINSLGQTYVGWRGNGSLDDRLSLCTDTGYWLHNEDFTGDQGTIYAMCLAGEALEDLWIIKEDENAIYRYDPNLTQVTKVETPTFRNANGICEDGEGGFWVGDYGNGSTWIRRYDKDGTHVATYDVSAYVQVVAQMKEDFQGGVWLLDTWGDQVARFANNGTFIGKAALLSPRAIDSTPAGCHAMSQTYARLYFINLDVSVEKTIYAAFYDAYSGSRWRGAAAASIEIDGYLEPEYIGSDAHWGTGGDLEWSEVGKDTNFVPRKNYHQARITLRSDGTDTPEVEKVALPPAVALYNIGPQSSKNVYMKTDVDVGTDDALRQGKIRSWFSVEE